MKLVKVGFAISAALVLASVGVLFWRGYDILKIEFWDVALRVVIQSPAAVFNEAASGAPDADLFIALAVLIGALCLAFLSFVSLNLIWLGSEIGKARNRKKHDIRLASRPKEKKEDFTEEEPNPPRKRAQIGLPARTKEKTGPSLADRIGSKIQVLRERRRKKVFTDRVADLDNEEVTKGWLARLGERLSARYKERKERNSKDLVIHSTGGEDKVVTVDPVEDFERDLKAWYDKLRVSEKGDPEVVRGARTLRERATGRARNFVLEEDAFNGDFMLRMMDAWADKEPATSAHKDIEKVPARIEDPEEKDAFARALEDVKNDGPPTGEEVHDTDAGDPDEIIRDFSGDDEDEGDPDFMAEEEAMDEGEEDESDQDFLVDEPEERGDEESAGGEEDQAEVSSETPRSIARVVEVSKTIWSYGKRAEAIAAGMEEWEEDLVDPSDRARFVDEMIDALTEAQEGLEEAVLTLDALDIDENEEVVEVAIRGVREPEALRSEIKHVSDCMPISPGEEGADTDEEEVALESVLLAPGAEKEYASQDDPGGGSAGCGAADDEGAQGDADIFEGPEREEEESAPRNLAIDELDEIETAGDTIFQWGMSAKQAGASKAKIGHVVLEKVGVGRRAVGVVHLVAQWDFSGQDESRNVYIILRRIPAGTWKIEETEDDIRAVDEGGNFVPIRKSLLESEEVMKGKPILHFHGDGDLPGLPSEVGGMKIVREPCSVEEIRDIMGSGFSY